MTRKPQRRPDEIHREPTKADIERVLEHIQPEGRCEECEREILNCLRLMADVKFMPPGAEKTALLAVADKAHRLLNAVKAVPKGILPHFRSDDLMAELDRLRNRCKEQASEIVVKEHSGRGDSIVDRMNIARKQIAAEYAFNFLNYWGRRMPTLTRNGEYFTLASILFEIATGREEENLERQCTHFLNQLRLDEGLTHEQVHRLCSVVGQPELEEEIHSVEEELKTLPRFIEETEWLPVSRTTEEK